MHIPDIPDGLAEIVFPAFRQAAMRYGIEPMDVPFSHEAAELWRTRKFDAIVELYLDSVCPPFIRRCAGALWY